MAKMDVAQIAISQTMPREEQFSLQNTKDQRKRRAAVQWFGITNRGRSTKETGQTAILVNNKKLKTKNCYLSNFCLAFASLYRDVTNVRDNFPVKETPSATGKLDISYSDRETTPETEAS